MGQTTLTDQATCVVAHDTRKSSSLHDLPKWVVPELGSRRARDLDPRQATCRVDATGFARRRDRSSRADWPKPTCVWSAPLCVSSENPAPERLPESELSNWHVRLASQAAPKSGIGLRAHRVWATEQRATTPTVKVFVDRRWFRFGGARTRPRTSALRDFATASCREVGPRQQAAFGPPPAQRPKSSPVRQT